MASSSNGGNGGGSGRKNEEQVPAPHLISRIKELEQENQALKKETEIKSGI